jgi:hypothetical protein
MRQFRVGWFAALFLFLASSIPAAAQQRGEPAPLFDTPGLAAEAIGTIKARVGREFRVALVDMRGSELVMHIEGARPGHVDQWRWLRVPGRIYGSWTRVVGPEPAQVYRSADIEGMYFSLEDAPLDDIPGLIAEIQHRAMLEEPALPQSIRIERQFLLMAGPRSGDPVISVNWSTGRESANVYLNLDGSIRGADVSGTIKARGLDMARDDWHLPMAARDFAVLSGSRDILKVEIEPRDIDVIYLDRQHPGASAGMRWTLDGLRMIDSAIPPPIQAQSHLFGPDPNAVFPFDEVDFALLPELKKAALERVDEPGTRVLKMVAERAVTGTGPAEFFWTLTIGDPANQGNWINRTEGEAWQVIATPRGEIVRVALPPSRRPQIEWWTAQGLREALDRVGTTFPAGHPFQQIVLDPDGGSVHTLDAIDPSVSRDFKITQQEITRSIFSPRPANVDASWFHIDDLDGYTADVISALSWKTFGEMNLPDGHVSRLTFSRGNPWVRAPEGQVMLEIRVERGFNGGRITWLADGTELDRVMPD